MARGVIRLARDIGIVMPVLCPQIKGCAYNPGAHLASFNRQGMAVVMQSGEILIHKVENYEAIVQMIDWLKSIDLTPSENS
jgi:hypothetical protein